VWGTADHRAHEQNFKQKLVSHADLPTGDVEMAFATALDEAVERDGGAAEIEWEKGVVLTGGDADKAHATVKDSGVKLAALYHETVSPSVLPTSVEEEFSVPGAQLGIPVPLQGRLDLIANVPAPELVFRPGADDVARVERVIERKTAGAKKKAASNPEYVTQARLYQLGYWLRTGKTIDVDFHLSLKPGPRRKSPGVVANDADMLIASLPAAAVKAQVQRLMVGISSCYAMYGPDEPWPGSWAGFASSCDFCGFKITCPWWTSDTWAANGATP
jgi:hypothetical protein